MKVLHVISEFSAHEAMGRTIVELASRVPGEHVLVAATVHDGAHHFAATYEVGGPFALFALRRVAALADVVRREQPDMVHLHGGALTAAWALSPALRHLRMVHTVYGWPRLPRWRDRHRATFSEMRRSNVLRPRVLLTTVLRPAAVKLMLRGSNTAAVLSPDTDVVERLGAASVPLCHLPSGATPDERRAAPEHADGAGPVVVFAGRSETVRGIDTLLAAFPLVREEVPGARLRLLLIPTAEIHDVEAAVLDAGLEHCCQVVTSPVADLSAELAAAQVGTWPFKFDYTTSPPAMALAEAMAVGLPVVSTDVTCVRSIATDDKNALLVPPSDHRALAHSLVRLLSDRALWTRLAGAGVDTIATTANWERAAEVTSECYDLALAPGASA